MGWLREIADLVHSPKKRSKLRWVCCDRTLFSCPSVQWGGSLLSTPGLNLVIKWNPPTFPFVWFFFLTLFGPYSIIMGYSVFSFWNNMFNFTVHTSNNTDFWRLEFSGVCFLLRRNLLVVLKIRMDAQFDIKYYGHKRYKVQEIGDVSPIEEWPKPCLFADYGGLCCPAIQGL